MSKREARKLKAGFIMVGGIVSASCLHNWGVGRILPLILGFSFFAVLWLSLVWVVKNTFDKW